MIDLYHSPDARSFRVLWALEELDVPYTLHLLAFPPRLTSPEFLKINPLGTVPFFQDGSVRMTESAAILQYLSVRQETSSLAVGETEPDYGAWLNWLAFGEATLTFPQALVLRYSRLEPVDRRQPQIVDDYSRWFLSRLRHVERTLETQAFLCAGRFTMADISVGYALMFAEILGLSERFGSNTRDYWNRLSARPAYGKAKVAQGPGMNLSEVVG